MGENGGTLGKEVNLLTVWQIKIVLGGTKLCSKS
jgi:hypothetical protein